MGIIIFLILIGFSIFIPSYIFGDIELKGKLSCIYKLLEKIELNFVLKIFIPKNQASIKELMIMCI